MTDTKRYLLDQILHDLDRQKMVFVSGPRQVGKTTLAKQVLGGDAFGYLSWDIPDHREMILKREFPVTPVWVFDEIHKYRSWRDFLKGVYDQFGDLHHILVTGSAKLDLYRRGGDSLQGRYYHLRLYPLSVAELKITVASEFDQLVRLGGFPEPFFGGNDVDSKRWSRLYRQRLLEEDVVSLESVKDLGNLELLMLRLPNLVGSPLSLNGLREDLQVSHKTVSNWMAIFTRVYAVFCLSPMGSPVIKAVKKEQKHYHFDWTLLEEDGARFENVVAVHALKWVHYLQDTQARDVELRYFRDIEGREVDIVILEKNNPIMAIECKVSDSHISPHLVYFKKKFPECRAYQLTAKGTTDFVDRHGIRLCPAMTLLNEWI